jgi:putative nucleotidyltransferase-like protein
VIRESSIAADEMSPECTRARFAQARRNGLPAWLWPDIVVDEWRAALEEIASATQKIFAGKSKVALASGDSKTMGIAGYTSGMGPLLGYWMENGTLSADMAVEETFRKHLRHNRQRMSRLSELTRRTLDALDAGGISPLILKGMHTAFVYFPEPGTRPLSDVDVYVPARSIPAAECVLSGLGYQRALRTRSPYSCDWTLPSERPEPRTLAFVHRDDPWSFDVTGTLDRRLMTGAAINLELLLPGCGRSGWPLCNKIGVLPQPLLTLYLAAHLSQILLNATLLRLTELVFVVRRDTKAGLLDWKSFLEEAAAMGGPRFVYPALVLCERLAPQTIPTEVLASASADAPQNLRAVVDRLTVANAQPLDRHSMSERFMWAANWRERLRQIAAELAFDGRGRPFRQVLHSTGSKLWALRQRRYSA